MISFQNENIAVGQKPILTDINLKIDEGEKVALIGPSGVGKTTLLERILQKSEKRVAMIHQHLNLVPRLSAYHNVYCGRLDQNNTLLNVFNLIKPLKRFHTEIKKILGDLFLEDKLFEPVYRLSGGQQQRVAIARSIFREPDILLGDEPFSAIDPGITGDILLRMMESAPTVILALHSLELAFKYFPRVVGLHDGTIFFDCPAAEVTETMLSRLYHHG